MYGVVFIRGAASFQPTLGFSVGNFSLTAWGSTSLSESNKEIDLTAAYKFGEAGPTLSVATLWWDGQADVANGELTNNYFHFKSGDTGHHFEAGLAYTLPIEKFRYLSHGIPCLPVLTEKRLMRGGKAGILFLRRTELSVQCERS